MPADDYADNDQLDHGPGSAVASPRDCQKLGGFDARAMTHGTWKTGFPATAYWGVSTWYGRVVQSNYNYRNTPSFLHSPLWVIAYYPIGGPPTCAMPAETDSAYMAYTKPQVKVTAGCPPFKTQKLLGSRAIVTDSFSQENHMLATNVVDEPHAGMAQCAHRDGYNVLYGDWSAKWYGDPNLRIMWWPADGMWHNNQTYCLTNISTNGIANYDTVGADPAWSWPELGSSLEVWHVFDVANGVDVE